MVRPPTPKAPGASSFSPYSRGWSHQHRGCCGGESIFPVFAGMVPRIMSSAFTAGNFPRIRGDGPLRTQPLQQNQVFSPYSRGWSRKYREVRSIFAIFPVFAGMVRFRNSWTTRPQHFPRIRGDGPAEGRERKHESAFSPYSRGWSPRPKKLMNNHGIFPVFAGMVPRASSGLSRSFYFPRIRGDGPAHTMGMALPTAFSPYLRGWSHPRVAEHPRVAIFLVFAGMARPSSTRNLSGQYSPRICGDDPWKSSTLLFSSTFSPYSRG